MSDTDPTPEGETHEVDAQARQQTGQQQVRLRVDERNLGTSYSNAFRTNASAEEVILDFGLNLLIPANQGPDATAQPNQPAGDILFQANHRVVMNYYTAKRLALTLGQVVRRHEERFGELKLNAAERTQQ